jgi:exopolysaccharide biosynthesis polyprenyl glycosylphosphotransferase
MQVWEREGSTSEVAAAVSPRALTEGSSVRALDPTTIAASRAHRQAVRHHRSRGWLVRRALLVADVTGLLLAFTAASELFQAPGTAVEYLVFLCTLPIWVVVAKLHGLYDKDEERTDHWTVDDVVGVVHLVTLGTWIVFLGSWATGAASPDIARLGTFWLFAVALLTVGRGVARGACRRSTTYCQNTIVVGAGDVGQLVARKALKHPEYGLNIVGFVDAQPRERRSDVGNLTVLGTPDSLAELIDEHHVERVIIAFSNDADDLTMDIVRQLRDFDLQIDVVPRLFELVGPRVAVHTIEGLPLVGLPPARPTPSSRLIKRTIDIVVSVAALVALSPLFVVVAFAIKRDSRGPVFFRQRRLGLEMEDFTTLKFRTMRSDTDDAEHRDYIRTIMSSGADSGTNGMYKLDRCDAVTRVGRLLRKTSLDELPQLINVVRGDMSLVGPRPCIPYEIEHFEPHHFERFQVPAGITGLWQVTARANSTFGEALEMDVVYVRGWSIGLDLKLLLRTPFALLRQRQATA